MASKGWGGRRPGAGRKRMMEESERISVRVETETIRELERAAQERGEPVSELIRRALRAYVKRLRR